MQKKVSWAGPVLAVFLSLLLLNPNGSSAAVINGVNDSMFGENIFIFDESMSDSAIQSIIDSKFAEMENGDTGAEFTDKRVTFLFKPGEYDVAIDVGFYTTVAGLGKNPDDVKVSSFDVDAQWSEGNATRNFWRSVENFSVVGTEDSRWAVSQAAPMRRMHFNKNLSLWDLTPWWVAGWASGGFIADSVIDGNVSPASQQQFFSRNSSYQEWQGSLWNTVLVGDENPPSNVKPYPEETYTIIDNTPVIREKPYLYIDDSGQYNIFVPELQENSKGVTWKNGSTPGKSISINDFYIANPSDSAANINAALSQGKHLFFTPGIYHVNETIEINNPNTIVYGMGYPTIIPENGVTVMKVADVDGVQLAGLLFDAGEVSSDHLLQVGPDNSSADHSANPISLHDLFFRVGGGTQLGKAEVSLEINADDVIGDHFWIWRADHGDHVGWNVNTGANGLVVNGDDVTLYGLFVEHFQEYQTLWNGNGGRTYFYQNEIPYDVPDQVSWMSHNGTVNGYAAYKVADSVTSHELWGGGSYSYFRDAAVKLYNSFEVPDVEGINLNHLTTVWLSGTVGSEITHIINNLGASVSNNDANMVANISQFLGGGNEGTGIERDEWIVTTNVAGSSVDLHLIRDGNEGTRWTTGTPMVPGQSLTIDLKAKQKFNQIIMESAGSADDYARGYEIFVSNDGTNWGNSIVTGTGNNARIIVDFANQTARYIKIVQTGTHDNWWSIAELFVNNDGNDQGNGEGPGYEWSVTTNITGSSTDPALIIDGDEGTRWTTATPMIPGQSLTVDMKSQRNISQIILKQGGGDYARGYEVYISNDGLGWGIRLQADRPMNRQLLLIFRHKLHAF